MELTSLPPRISDCGDNGKLHDLVLRRSTDNGQTWGPMLLVRKGTVPCSGCPAAVSNPNPVEVTFPDGSKKVLLHFDTMNNPSLARHGLDMQMWSSDDGLSWSNASVLAYPPQPNLGGLIGPSVGIQGANGAIYFSQISPNRNKTLYWSNDFGVTWSSSRPLSGLGECSIAFLNTSGIGDILMNCRVGGEKRAQIRWTPEGVPGSITYPAGLIDPNCQGALINHGGRMLFSNANTTNSRSHMTVKSSRDEGMSWDEGVLVWAGKTPFVGWCRFAIDG